MAEKNAANDIADREILSTRVFNAPRELVFKAWSEAEHIINWWGPNGFTNTFHTFDFRQGGKWSFVMHGPDGKDYPNESVFVEIKAPEKIVLDHILQPKFRLTATFTEVNGGRTLLTFQQLFETQKIRDAVKVYAAPANEENFDKLAIELKKMT